MICATDVDYREAMSVAACVAFTDWADASALEERTAVVREPPAAYRPGEFFRRELPLLIEVLGTLAEVPTIVIVDGHVWLGQGASYNSGRNPAMLLRTGAAGLGAHLYEALDRRAVVIGVAKRAYRDGAGSIPVLRGTSQNALWVSAIGMRSELAAAHVKAMHGAFRLPTLLKRADRLARTAE